MWFQLHNSCIHDRVFIWLQDVFIRAILSVVFFMSCGFHVVVINLVYKTFIKRKAVKLIVTE